MKKRRHYFPFIHPFVHSATSSIHSVTHSSKWSLDSKTSSWWVAVSFPPDGSQNSRLTRFPRLASLFLHGMSRNFMEYHGFFPRNIFVFRIRMNIHPLFHGISRKFRALELSRNENTSFLQKLLEIPRNAFVSKISICPFTERHARNVTEFPRNILYYYYYLEMRVYRTEFRGQTDTREPVSKFLILYYHERT